jgi:hypothetical protein
VIDYNNRSAILSMALTIFRNSIYQRKKRCQRTLLLTCYGS